MTREELREQLGTALCRGFGLDSVEDPWSSKAYGPMMVVPWRNLIETIIDNWPQEGLIALDLDVPFDQWPDCCRRTGNWGRRAPRLFRCPTCGEVMHTKLDRGALHHQRLHPGSTTYITHKFVHFDETDTPDFGMYVGDDIEAHRGEMYWPHFELEVK